MTVHDFQVTAADNTVRDLGDFSGKVLLIVNVASKCGLTPQYEGLQALYRDFQGRGLEVLGFPCNQFGGQEPGTDAEIQDFCSTNFDVSFPVFAKLDVNGPDAAPLFAHLRAEAPGDFGPDHGFLYEHVKNTRPEAIGTDEVKWNFTKFLVDGAGKVIRRYEPTTAPEEIRADLDALLPA
ncbi:glutathione peroxidase [Actinocorallia populi]|uniref:glutathione peroxidase n=1 Tax=Actinocorallia populi TaxID=2079200 RepID=UPI000D0938A9|nr:glutathione peroxidase [Actinocorallia populi]